MAENLSEIGIKYRVIKLEENTYILVPVDFIEGYSVAEIFYSEDLYKIPETTDILESEEYVIESIRNLSNLKTLYDFDDTDFIKSYYLEEEKDYFIYIEIIDNKIKKKKIKTSILKSENPKEEYEIIRNQPAITLNIDALNSLLSEKDINNLHNQLLRYKSFVKKFQRKNTQGVTRITLENNRMSQIETIHQVKEEPVSSGVKPEANPQDLTDISLIGLERYIKERIIGHDVEIRKIAKSIIMNYTACPGEKNEPILLVGPTGTGKTQTMKSAIEYLNIPLIEVDASNLVPQGIKGMTLEDCLYSLIVTSGHNQKKAEKGLIYLDEFDKLGKEMAEYKNSVVQILLKFLEGGTFLIDQPTENYTFKTHSLIKILSGTFSELFENKKSLGFIDNEESLTFKPKNITEKDYFGKELVTRIPHIIVYHELTREQKKLALLTSKVSEYLLKKARYKRQFNVDLIAEDSYIEAVLDKLKQEEKSMRDLNNLIIESLDEAEYEMLINPTSYKRLVLTSETVKDNRKFDLS